MICKEEIIRRVNDCDGLVDIEGNEKYIYAYDKQEDMQLYFKFLEDIDFDSLFDFGTQKVDKEAFYKVIREYIDMNLFIMPEKIYLINNEEELDNLLEEFPCQGMNMDGTVGINWVEDSVIVINVCLIKKLVNEDIEQYPSINFKEEFNRAMWETLIHELRHMACDIGLIITEDEMPIEEGSEDCVEEYCRKIFETHIEGTKDYMCFSI